MSHPTPWRVTHDAAFSDWHPLSLPKVVDANGDIVCELRQNVDHPGDYDHVAEITANTIVGAVNFWQHEPDIKIALAQIHQISHGALIDGDRNTLHDALLKIEVISHNLFAKIKEVATTAEECDELWHCQSCQAEGSEDDFSPTEAHPGTRACPKCGSLDVFWK